MNIEGRIIRRNNKIMYNKKLYIIIFIIILMISTGCFQEEDTNKPIVYGEIPEQEENSDETAQEPVKLKAESISDTAIRLEWQDVPNDEREYIIERSINDSTNYREITTINKDKRSYTDTGLEPFTKYYYRIKVIKEDDSIEYSNEVDTKTYEISLECRSDVMNRNSRTSPPLDDDCEYHRIFNGKPGKIISSYTIDAISAMEKDPTGKDIYKDYDSDGIPNEEEIETNPFVTDYPRITARISAPIAIGFMKAIGLNYIELLENDDIYDTIINSFDACHYSYLNENSTIYNCQDTASRIYGFDINIENNGNAEYNDSFISQILSTTMSEKIIFDYLPVMDGFYSDGLEFSEGVRERVIDNYSNFGLSDYLGQNNGYVRAALYLENSAPKIPVKVTNIIGTLFFKKPDGELLPVRSFRLRNEDYSIFEHEFSGEGSYGPRIVELRDINTNEIRSMLSNGYLPQFGIAMYDIFPIKGSDYNPGVEDLKAIDENSQKRTAEIKIIGEGHRDLYRVVAFDIDCDGEISPGTSLKKALFNIFRNRSGDDEWDEEQLTVRKNGLRWITGKAEHEYAKDEQGEYINIKGNSWVNFETSVKTYIDNEGKEHRIETIKRIGDLEKYNPFNTDDNPFFDTNNLLNQEELSSMKYWVIFHNGRYLNGDINDLIWVGDRFEIICLSIEDLNERVNEMQ
ncbi:MAG: fibronectin type III domain-containing protein [Candidatus Hodarchaeales archaeon]